MRALMLTLALLSFPLCAAERSGPYLGAGYGMGTFYDDGFYDATDLNEKGVWRVSAGAYINEHLSVEVDYSRFDGFMGIHPEFDEVEERFDIFSVSAAAHYLLLDDTVDLFGRFGAGEINWEERGGNDRSSAAGTLLMGCGIGYRFTPEVMLKAGFDLYTFGLHETADTFDMRLNLGYTALEVQF